MVDSLCFCAVSLGTTIILFIPQIWPKFEKLQLHNNHSLSPKPLGLAMDTQQLIRAGHMYSFPSFYHILSKIILTVTSLIYISLFITYTNVMLGIPLPFLTVLEIIKRYQFHLYVLLLLVYFR
jgi:hypothetical protein